jgi:hypothetical protein
LTNEYSHVIIKTQRERETPQRIKEIMIMKYRVYNEKNYSERLGYHLATYFRTKKEAVAYAAEIGGNVHIERKCCDTWVAC